MGGHLVVIEITIEKPVGNDGYVNKFKEDERIYKRKQHMPREWWKNHILFQHGKGRANVAFVDDHLNLCKTLRFEDASKWEATIQEEYDSLIGS